MKRLKIQHTLVKLLKFVDTLNLSKTSKYTIVLMKNNHISIKIVIIEAIM